MLRVIGGAQDKATRIENRMGEPAANPYLCMAAQIHAGLDGIKRQLIAPAATTAPYGATDARLPGSLSQALEALNNDLVLGAEFGADFIDYFNRVKRSEITRHDMAEDKDDWQRREYFGRI